jgi:hypothetical protein
MNPIERLPFLDVITDFSEYPDASAFVDWRACGAGEAIQSQTVNFGNRTVVRCENVESEFADIGAAVRGPLGIDYCLHLPHCRAALEQFSCAGVASSTSQLGVVFQKMRR